MWQTRHWLDGMPIVNLCAMGCPDSSFGIIGSGEAVFPVLPNTAKGPEWTGERSFAYGTWHAVQPLERKSPGESLVPMKERNGSLRRVLWTLRRGRSTRLSVPSPRSESRLLGRPGSSIL